MSTSTPPNLSFRKATKADYAAIATIHNANVRDRQPGNPNGFLLAPVTVDEVQTEGDPSTHYFVATLGDELVGFVSLLQPTLTADKVSMIQWTDPSFQAQILQAQPFYIKVVATHPHYARRGVGRFLYTSLFKRFPDAAFSAFIAVKPIENTPSLLFHQKQGFNEVGRVQLDQFLDLKNYESVLMFKPTTMNSV